VRVLVVPLLPLIMLLLVIKAYRTWLSVRAPRSFSDSSNGVFIIPIAHDECSSDRPRPFPANISDVFVVVIARVSA